MNIHYFKGFTRHLAKYKGYFLVHLFGITLGLTAAGISVMYLHHELSYDTNHAEPHRIYRVSYQNKSGWFAALPRSYSDALQLGSVTGIESLVRFRRWPAKIVRVGDERFQGQRVLFTDPCTKFFSFFNFPLVEGNPDAALVEPNSVVISETLAKRYFGDPYAVGKTFRLDTLHLTVTGVMKDLPSNTHLVFDMLIANTSAMDAASGHFTYARLLPTENPAAIADRVMALKVEVNAFQTPVAVKLINLPALHYAGNMTYELKPPGSRSYLWILGAIGLIIVVIAGTNYANLSVALYAYRSREIAVRKSIGASARGLSGQFFLESCATILVAIVLSVCLLQVLAPAFNTFMDLRIESPLRSVWVIGTVVVLGLTIAGCAAIYPISVLPGIRILDLFRNSGITTHHGLRLRRTLLTIQFAILFFVCVSLWFIHSQVNFMMNKDLGFVKEGVLKLKGAWNVDSTHYWKLKEELKQHPAVQFVSEGYAPGDEDYGYNFGAVGDPVAKGSALMHSTDVDYLSVLGIAVVEGADIRNGATVTRRLCYVNQTLATALGLRQAVGEKFVLNHGEKNERTITIDGVVADYNFHSLHATVGPQILWLSNRSKSVDGTILVKVSTENLATTVAFVQEKLNAVVPNEPVTIDFMDQDLARLYYQEVHLDKAVSVLLVISLILSFTGLLALCSYMVEFRLREVALRKVFGADAAQIIVLFSGSFMKVLVVSFAIGAVLSVYFLQSWIATFAYRVTLGALPYFLAFCFVSGLTLMLVGAQSLRAIRQSPARILRNE